MEQRAVHHAGFFLLLVLVTLAFFGLIQSFFQPLFAAAVLAIIFRPLARRLEDAFHGRRASAAMFTILAIVILVFVPLAMVGLAVSREALGLYDRVGRGQVAVPEVVTNWSPVLVNLGTRVGIDTEDLQQNIAEAAGTGVQLIATQAVVFGQNALRVGAQTALMLYVLFFFLRDGDRIMAAIVRAIPLGGGREQVLFARFAAVTRATLKGTLVVGAIQGLLGGLLFWLVDIRAPVFWGVIMAIFSLVPLLGPAFIWLPAAIYLVASGSIVSGIILTVAGVLVVGLADNILRPILVGRETKLPDYLVLLSTLGGLAAFGLAGFIVGPVLAALFLSVWDMFAREYAGRDDLPAQP